MNKIGNFNLGVGKTALAQAAALESGSRYISVQPSSILSKYQGDTEKYIKNIFDAAIAAEPTIIFFDGNFFFLIFQN